MTWNNRNIVGHVTNHLPKITDVAVDAATARHVNVGEGTIEQLVAHMQYVGLFEPHHGVAIGMPLRQMNQRQFIAVEVNGYRISKGHQGQGAGG